MLLFSVTVPKSLSVATPLLRALRDYAISGRQTDSTKAHGLVSFKKRHFSFSREPFPAL